MKENWKYKKLFYVMIIVVFISLVLTAFVVADIIANANGKEDKYWFFEESIQTGKKVELNNAYIYSNNNGQFEFLYDNITYAIEGYLESEYSGIADVVVNGDKIEKVRIKQDEMSGTLHSYSENSVTVICEISDVNVEDGINNSDQTTTTMQELIKKETIPLYKVIDGKVSQANWNQVIVGTTKLHCVLEKGQVCAVIIEESLPSDIRVIIKNGSKLFYEDLYIKKESSGALVDINGTLEEQNTSILELSDDKGLYLCDEKGAPKGEVYEGIFRVIKTEEGLVLINELPIETYVKYVLPSEMPTTFHEEALKAQAVCARTFAYAQMRNQSYSKYGANLDDSTSFQVYHKTGRYEKTDNAVDATKGEVITCNGELISCYYFSTSAGKTNDMTVWGSQTPVYIVQKESVDDTSAFYKWNAYLDISEIKEKDKGALKSIEIVKSNASGYVIELKILYENETVILTNENEIRSILGKYLQEVVLNNGKVRTDLSMIPSANFSIYNIADNQIVVSGGGFGHGIGMSQYGANQMAIDGISYKAIIEYYYRNVVVKSV